MVCLRPAAQRDDGDLGADLAQQRNQAAHVHTGQLPSKQQEIGALRPGLLEKAGRINSFSHNFQIGLALLEHV